MVKNIENDNEVRESAAKLDELTNHLEGSETIPRGSTSENPNSDGSACPRPDNAEGEEIVHGKNYYKNYFISKAKEKFNNKFDYSKVEYTRIKDKVTIICPIHGEFLQSMEKHLGSTYGCPLCMRELKKHNTTNHVKGKDHPTFVTFEKFIEIANKKYNNKFTYITEGINWTGLCSTTIKVVCPIHGEFEINANVHIMKNNSSGCPKCGNEKRAKSKSISYDDILLQIYDKYGDKYIIPEENRETYVNKHSILKIICPIHGIFYKRASKFLIGQECHLCKMENSKKLGLFPGGYDENWLNEHPEYANKKSILYYVEILYSNNTNVYKIGITTKTLEERLIGLYRGAKSIDKNVVIKIINLRFDTLYNVHKIELEILLQYKEYRIVNSWSTELFRIDIYNFIKNFF